MSRLGIFGGSFNPIHLAHLVLAERARCERRLDGVWFMPARKPPHKPSQPLAPAEDRLRMVELAIEGNPAFEALRLEIDRPGPSYTLLSVRELRERAGPEAELFLLMGGDSVREIPTWWRAEELVGEVEIIAFCRPGSPLEDALAGPAERFGAEWAARVMELRVEAPLLGISSTQIRERARAGRSIRYLVPDPVRLYIEERGLYRGT